MLKSTSMQPLTLCVCAFPDSMELCLKPPQGDGLKGSTQELTLLCPIQWAFDELRIGFVETPAEPGTLRLKIIDANIRQVLIMDQWQALCAADNLRPIEMQVADLGQCIQYPALRS